jgi:exonuclease III
MVGFAIYLAMLTLNVNGFNPPIKRHPLAKCINKQDLIICLQKTHHIDRNKHLLRVEGWKKKNYQANGPWKQAEVTILISDEVDFKLPLVKWDKEGHFILIIGSIHQKEITNINLYVPNFSAANFIKHTLKDLTAHIDPNTTVVGDFNTTL